MSIWRTSFYEKCPLMPLKGGCPCACLAGPLLCCRVNSLGALQGTFCENAVNVPQPSPCAPMRLSRSPWLNPKFAKRSLVPLRALGGLSRRLARQNGLAKRGGVP